MPEAHEPLQLRRARLAIVAGLLQSLIAIGFGAVGATAIGRMLPVEWQWVGRAVAVLLVVALLLDPVLSHRFTRWVVTDESLTQRRGWMHRTERTIAWSSVQAIDRTTTWSLRLFGLATLTVAQAGQEATRIAIDGISAATIEQVLARARASRDDLGLATEATAAEVEIEDEDDARAAASGVELYRASVWDLAVMSVMFGAAVLAAPAVAFGAWEHAGHLGLQGWLQQLWARFEPISAAIVIGIAAILVSIAATVLQHFRFTVTRDGDALRIRHGLLITKERTFREASIQGVVVQRNLLEQCSGRARLWLLTIDGDDHLGQNLVLPSLPLRVVERIAREAFPTRVPAGPLLAVRPPWLTTLLTMALALGVAVAVYLACTTQLGWAPLVGGIAAIVALLLVSAVCRVLLARFELDGDTGLLLLRRTYGVESLRAVDLTAVRRVSAMRVPRWLARGALLLPQAAIYAGRATTLRALRAAPATMEAARSVSVAHAPVAAAALLARRRG